jgi:hypothetical protein
LESHVIEEHLCWAKALSYLSAADIFPPSNPARRAKS